MSVITPCDVCYKTTVPCCATSIVVKTSLTPATSYDWHIVDRFNNEYLKNITTDSNGHFAIAPDVDTPVGLLTPESAVFKLYITLPGTNTIVLLAGLPNNPPCVEFTLTNISLAQTTVYIS